MSKRIVIVGNSAAMLLRFRLSLMKTWRDRGHAVVAVVPTGDLDAAERDDIVRVLAEHDIETRLIRMRRLSMNVFYELTSLLALFWLLWRERPTHVMAYSIKPILYVGFSSFLLRSFAYFPMFSGLGRLFNVFDARNRNGARFFARLGVWLALARAATVIFQNKHDRMFLRRHNVVGDRKATVVVAGSGVDLREFPKQPLPRRRGLVFVMIARVLYEKGVSEYAQAAALVSRKRKGLRFLLYGGLENENVDNAPTLSDIEAMDPIEYMGCTDDVQAALAGAHVFVLPSFYREGVPRSSLEALACGRAIITTDEPGCRETVADGVNGLLIPSRDPMALAGAMEKFIRDRSLCVSMGKESRMLAQQRFDVDLVNDIINTTMKL